MNKEPFFEMKLDCFFRGKRFLDPQYWTPYEIVGGYDRPENIPIYMMQQVKEGLTKENVIQFISWFELEMTKTGIEGWTKYGSDGGSTLTEFGEVSFQVNFNDIIISIKKV
jgi:hypothetical protein